MKCRQNIMFTNNIRLQIIMFTVLNGNSRNEFVNFFKISVYRNKSTYSCKLNIRINYNFAEKVKGSFLTLGKSGRFSSKSEM